MRHRNQISPANQQHLYCRLHNGLLGFLLGFLGGGPRVVVSTAAFHAGVRGSFPGLGGLKEAKMFLPHPLVKTQHCGEPPWPRASMLGLRPPGFEFRSCVWRAVSYHHPQEVLLAGFSLYVHKCGLKPDSFHYFLLGLGRRISHFTQKQMYCVA